ncbi:hypothetical protein N7450_010067 [Penicillium hetheringtonii]|uniref:Uncharacterized protein n=1 Tax=Penicillium hetheringtonii TaxID=911720 RepID=A0AAD6GP01_9EURO|nr:hypothetical protein N7450_010067 [Penicillium hetheringtonii]
MDDQPRRRRRSSISEHFQRVFSVDRSDKKRPSNGFQSGRRDAALVPNSETTIGFEVGTTTTNGTVETGPSSFTHSTRPSVSTAESSPPVHPVRIKDEDSKQATSNMKAPTETNDTNPTTSTADIDRICSSPIWAKDVNRKERRATKRLEAERKELEKRLSNLEEAQLKLEQGIYDRNSRRLTKKQPLDSSKRSSSANTERPRSSSFTSLFSSKRRSRSRASSMNGSDRDSRTSSEFGGPPTLPLSLTERFGTAVSRELATRHGTSLVPSHQMPRTLHHTTGKSDDLRENWKMAEEWKKRNGGAETGHTMSMTTTPARNAMSMSKKSDTTKRHTLTETYVHRRIEPSSKSPSHPHSQATELSADLDRDSFTAALRNERTPPGVASRTPNSPIPLGNYSTRNQGAKAITQSENRPPTTPDIPVTPAAPTAPTVAATVARQMNGISNTHPQSQQKPQTQSSPKPMAYYIPTATAASKQGTFPKGRVDANPKAYKSSPLALNPFTNKDVERKNRQTSNSANQQTGHSNSAQPSSLDGQKGFSRENENHRPALPMTTHPVAPNKHTPTSSPPQRPTKERPREEKPAKTASPDFKLQQMSSDANMPPLMVPPLKHSRRRQATDSPARSTQEIQEMPVVDAKTPSSAEQPAQEPPSKPQSIDAKTESPRRIYQLTDGGHGNDPEQNGQYPQRPGHSRTSSQSSYGGSSYDTADEEVLDISKAHTRVKPAQPSPPQAPAPEPSPHRETNPHSGPLNKSNQEPRQNAAIAQHSAGANPTLAPDGPLSMMRQVLVQRTKKPQKDQVIAKVFVICCSCKYWHDMPSEIYARLACPERLPTESRLMRTFSRKNSSHRRNSLFDPARGLPSQLLVQSPKQGNSTGVNGGGVSASQSAPIPCNWCGHSMTRSCCQGWTTLVQMRDRHH